MLWVTQHGAREWLTPDLQRFHRVGGPARESVDGGKEWWVHGHLYREEGPAVERSLLLVPMWRQGEFVRGRFEDDLWPAGEAALAALALGAMGRSGVNDEGGMIMAKETKKPEVTPEVDDEPVDAGFLALYEEEIVKAKNPTNKTTVRGRDEVEFRDARGRKHRVGGPAVVSPNYVEWWVDGALSRDGGPSLVYRDGMKLWHLRGIRVPQRVAEARDCDFDPEMFSKAENVEVRAAVIRKFGVERVLKVLDAKVLDSDKARGYELLSVNLAEAGTQKALKMVNPSTKTLHVEFVPPTCETIQDALKFRNGTDAEPIVLT